LSLYVSSGSYCVFLWTQLTSGCNSYVRAVVAEWQTQCSGVPIRQLTSPRLVKCPAFEGTRGFVTLFTEVHHLPLSWARWSHSGPSYPVSLRSIVKYPIYAKVFQVVSCVKVFRLKILFTYFPKIRDPPQYSKRQEGDMEQAPYWGRTNIRTTV